MSAKAFSNVRAEISILGAAIQDKKAAELAAGLAPENFTDTRHRLIHAAIVELSASKTPVDLVTVDAQLQKGERLGQIGGTAYLIELAQEVPTAANVSAYIKLVTECTRRRQMREIGRRMYEAAADEETDIEEERDKLAIELRAIRSQDIDEIISSETAMMRTLDKLEENNKPEGNKRLIKTGIGPVDRRIGGYMDGKLIYIGARPNVGKSAVALAMADNAADKQNKRVLFSSLEMPETEITERLLAKRSKVGLDRLTSCNLDVEEWGRIMPCCQPIAGLPLFYVLTACTVPRLSRAAYAMKEDGGLDMIVVDYIQLMEAVDSKKQNRQEQIAEISRGLRKLARELNIPIIVLTQLNRQSEGGGFGKKRRPTIAEARESGAIEQDANIFFLLHTPDREELEEEDREAFDTLKRLGIIWLEIIVGKNRQGPKGIAKIGFKSAFMDFTEIDLKVGV